MLYSVFVLVVSYVVEAHLRIELLEQKHIDRELRLVMHHTISEVCKF